MTGLCPSCGKATDLSARFCGQCGAPLAMAPPPPAPPSGGQRKQLTVLVADVKGSMNLQEDLDPEEWAGIMDRYVRLLADGVHRFGGTVDRFTGDGVMALFGAPLALEDHAHRACLAALDLARQIAAYADELRGSGGPEFLVRIGLNSGEAVVGRVGEGLQVDPTALGYAVGLAQRMEGLAEPGRAYLTEYTAGLVRGAFRLTDVGLRAVDGLHEPIGVFALDGTSLRTSARTTTPIVGRRAELDELAEAFATAAGGSAQVVGIMGEAAWTGLPYYRQLSLSRLRTDAVGELLGGLLGLDLSLAPLVAFVSERTGGNPFFVEEVVRDMMEDGTLAGAPGAYQLTRPLHEVRVPPSVHAVLAARIDRLPPAQKDLLQTAAVIGRTFSQPVLARVADAGESVAEQLVGLCAAELLQATGSGAVPEFRFWHPLTQEVAYGTLLASRRAGLHARVVEALAEHGADSLDEHSAELAWHWEQAGRAVEAARWNLRAAGYALRNDLGEAMRRWRATVALLAGAEETSDSLALGVQAHVRLLQFGGRVGIGPDEAARLYAWPSWATACSAGPCRSGRRTWLGPRGWRRPAPCSTRRSPWPGPVATPTPCCGRCRRLCAWRRCPATRSTSGPRPRRYGAVRTPATCPGWSSAWRPSPWRSWPPAGRATLPRPARGPSTRAGARAAAGSRTPWSSACWAWPRSPEGTRLRPWRPPTAPWTWPGARPSGWPRCRSCSTGHGSGARPVWRQIGSWPTSIPPPSWSTTPAR